MPQIGWLDPATGQGESFEHWLAQAEQHGEALGFPYEVLLGMYRQEKGDHRPNGITVTQLLGCARSVYLRGSDDYFAPAESGYDAFRGVIGHAMLEKAQHPGAIVERRFWRMYRGEAISGQLDKFMVIDADGNPSRAMTEAWSDYLDKMFAYEQALAAGFEPGEVEEPAAPFDPETVTFVIEDWKTKDKVPFGIYVYDGHKSQGNIYRWLVRAPRARVAIKFVYVSMKEVKGLPVYNGGKFANGRERPVQVWTDDEVEAFLDERMRVLALQKKLGRPLPYHKVPADDLWECDWCPVKAQCYQQAGAEMRAEWEKGKDVDRVPPRNADDEKKVKLPGRAKKKAAPAKEES